ncbi:MAG: hypothetical protein D6726_05405 [Nitrospirae bacterium]|nr:MAG: hypothetical protein D6726_05405 [Nitrospirota bacterium]
MANKENIKQRMMAINPKAWEFLQEFDRVYEEITGEKPYGVIVTEDMTPEEEKMAILEYYLRQGMPLEKAEKETEEFYKKIQKAELMFEKMRREKGRV